MITNTSIGRYGRFANMLFQIAAVVGIARKSGQSYGFLPLENADHRDRFGSNEPVDINNYFVNRFPRLDKEEKMFVQRPYSWGYHDIYLPAGDWAISGHFQSERYFMHAIDEVRGLLTMHNEQDYTDYVAIHVRRGDYDDKYHPRLGMEYYKLALEQFPPETKFLIFSDDIPAARELLGLGANFASFTYVSGGDYLQDFRIMKRCGGFITANSSFSLMAAILSPVEKKKIICPRTWFGPAWKPSTVDIYPRGSIQV